MKLFGREREETKREEAVALAALETVGGVRIPLPAGPTVVGRTHGPELGLGDDDQVSRRHAVFEVSAIGVRLRDLDSRNGTYVNGEWVSMVWLKNGDKIRLGGSELLFWLTA